MTYAESLRKRIAAAQAALKDIEYEHEINGSGELILARKRTTDPLDWISLNLPAILELVNSQPDKDLSKYIY